MDNCLTKELRSFSLLSPHLILSIIKAEGRELEITKSLLNILYNIVVVESIEATPEQKKIFELKEGIIWHLLDSNVPLLKKKRVLEKNIDIAACIAKSCQETDWSS